MEEILKGINPELARIYIQRVANVFLIISIMFLIVVPFMRRKRFHRIKLEVGVHQWKEYAGHTLEQRIYQIGILFLALAGLAFLARVAVRIFFQ